MKKSMVVLSKKYLLWVLLLPLLSCGGAPLEIRAFIDNNPKWKMLENCGYQGCYPMVDFLTSEVATIRIEYDEGYHKEDFNIKIFISELHQPLSFNPSKLKARFVNDIELMPKGVRFGLDKNQMRANPSLQESVLLKKYDGFHLFFDHSALVVGDGFTLDFNNAFTLNGIPVDVPVIYLKRINRSKR